MVLTELKLTEFIAQHLIRKFPTRFVGADWKVLVTSWGPAICNGTALEGRGVRCHVRSLSTRGLSLKLGAWGPNTCLSARVTWRSQTVRCTYSQNKWTIRYGPDRETYPLIWKVINEAWLGATQWSGCCMTEFRVVFASVTSPFCSQRNVK